MNQQRFDLAALAAAAGMIASLGCASTPLDMLGAFDPQACAEDALRRSADPAILPGSVELLWRGCSAGEADACSIAGVMYEHGRGVRPDRERARWLYERACSRRNARACVNLAELLLRSGDDRRARGLLHDGCRAGQGRACLVLGRTTSEGTSAPVAARALFERACGAGEAAGCVALADLLERSGAPGDPDRAIEVLGRACARGDEHGCARYAQRTLVSGRGR